MLATHLQNAELTLPAPNPPPPPSNPEWHVQSQCVVFSNSDMLQKLQQQEIY